MSSSSGQAASVSVLVLTRDEELNLPRCLESVADWVDEIFLVDSGSRDRTCEIAKGFGAEVLFHPFETHARQWNWVLQSVPVRTRWILALDADQRVTRELRDEILESLPSAAENVGGFYLSRRQIFRGRWIRHGGYYPKYLLKLFRRGAAWVDENDLVDHRFYVKGATRRLRSDLIEENVKENDIAVWLEKHIRYAGRQAQEEFRRRSSKISWTIRPSLWGDVNERTLYLRDLWYRLPLYLRPFLYFGYRYFIRLGFLDGKEGFVFHFLQAFWYRLIVDIKLDELRCSSGWEDLESREQAADVAVREVR